MAAGPPRPLISSGGDLFVRMSTLSGGVSSAIFRELTDPEEMSEIMDLMRLRRAARSIEPDMF